MANVSLTEMKRPDDGDPFNAGWEACRLEIVERVRKMEMQALDRDERTILIAKCDVLALLK
jgi:hypothetical protein